MSAEYEKRELQKMAGRLKASGMLEAAKSVERLSEQLHSKALGSVPSLVEKFEIESKKPLVVLDTDMTVEPMWKNEFESLLIAILRNSPDMQITVSVNDLITHGTERLITYTDAGNQTITVKLEL